MKLLPILMLAANLKKQRSKEKEKGVDLAGLQYVYTCLLCSFNGYQVKGLDMSYLLILVLLTLFQISLTHQKFLETLLHKLA